MALSTRAGTMALATANGLAHVRGSGSAGCSEEETAPPVVPDHVSGTGGGVAPAARVSTLGRCLAHVVRDDGAGNPRRWGRIPFVRADRSVSRDPAKVHP